MSRQLWGFQVCSLCCFDLPLSASTATPAPGTLPSVGRSGALVQRWPDGRRAALACRSQRRGEWLIEDEREHDARDGELGEEARAPPRALGA